MLHTFIVPSDDTSAAALTLSPLIGRRCQLRGLAISGMTHSLAPDVPIDVPETFAKPTTSVPYRTNRTFPVPVAGAASATWDTEFQASFAFITPWDTENYAASSIFLGLPALLTSRVSTAS